MTRRAIFSQGNDCQGNGDGFDGVRGGNVDKGTENHRVGL